MMKNFKHHKANKIMLAMSLILFLSAGLLLGVKAFTIDTSLLNTMQVIKRIVISNTNSTSSADVLMDINNDSAGTVYIKNKLGIGDSTPSAALEVSGTVIANQYCDSDGTTCTTISGIAGGTFTELDPIYNTGTNGKLCMQVNEKIVCETDTSSGAVDTNAGTICAAGEFLNGDGTCDAGYLDADGTDDVLTESEVDTFVANNGYITSTAAGLWATGTNSSISYVNGNVGIGIDASVDYSILSTKGDICFTSTGQNCADGSQDTDLDIRFIAGNGTNEDADPHYAISPSNDGRLRILQQTNTEGIRLGGDRNTTNLVIKTGGNIGIGTDNPTEALHVSGNILANAFLYPSDRRLKTNIVKLNPALDKIRQITPYTFDRKSNGKPSIGFIAQELEKIYPILVHTNDDGYKSVNYVNMVVPLTQAVKELDAENQELKAEIAEIKAMLAKQ